ncbi:MAG: hypothetical protein ABIJ37_07475 [Pseudomonadota bacterium]
MWQFTHKTTCGECRAAYEEDDRLPPCEEKDHCPINAVDLLPECQFALDFYSKIKSLGADLVFKLEDITLSKVEAENLLDKLGFIAGTISTLNKKGEE